MPTNLPAGVDAFTDPQPTDALTGHAAQHDHINDAMLAVENMLLAGNSYVVTGIDTTGVVAADSLINAAITATAVSGGTIVLPAATAIRINASLTPLGKHQGMLGPGSDECTLMFYGSGPCIWGRDPGFTINAQGSGGSLSGFSIDGTNAAAGAEGIRWGDLAGGKWDDIQVLNFNGAGSIGVHFQNQYGFCEYATYRHVRCIANTNGVIFEQKAVTVTGVTTANPGVVHAVAHGATTGNLVSISGVLGATQANVSQVAVTVIDADHFSIPVNVTGTYISGGTAFFGYNSFDYSVYELWIQSNANQNGLIIRNNVNMYGVLLQLRGNYVTGATNTGVVLTFGVGATDACVFQGALDITVENNLGGGGSVAHKTITIGGGSGTFIQATGVLTFIDGGGGAFVPMVNVSKLTFAGLTRGDATIGANVFGYAMNVLGGLVGNQGFMDTSGIYLDGGNVFWQQWPNGNTILVFNNASTGRAMSIDLIMVQPASGAAATFTWPASVKFPGGVKTMSAANNAVDKVHLATLDQITWYATIDKAFA